MDTFVEIGVWTVLAFFLGMPVFWAWRLVWCYRRDAQSQSASPECPPACVILSLRGTDPFLGDCLAGLLRQDYPDYSLTIIVDSEMDPAWEFVQRLRAPAFGVPALAGPGREDRLKPGLQQSADRVPVRVETLRERHPTCSLKVSSILQGLAVLDERVEVVALIDADVIPSRTWLRTLVAPLQDPRVGAATGIRWYAPSDKSWGSLVRFMWNAVAIIQMHAFGIAWGGSLAFHARVFRHPATLARWLNSFCEDTGTSGLVRELGQQLRFVTGATMVNAESIDLRSCWTFIRRQLFCARVHFVSWKRLSLFNLGMSIGHLGTVGLLLAGLCTENWAWAIGMGGLLGFHILGLLFAVIGVDRSIRAIVRRRGEAMPAFPWAWKFPLAALLAMAVHAGALVSASLLRRIAWRGITYAVDGPHRLRLLEYHPYRPPVQVTQTGESIL